MNYQALNAYIEAARDRPFEWGKNDCCTFAFGAIEALTGENRMAEFQYHDKESANRALRETGQGTLYRTMVKKFGRPLHPSRAQRGDIGYRDKMLGVVMGAETVFVGEEGTREGLVTAPTLENRWVFRA